MDEIRTYIAEHYDGAAFEPLSGPRMSPEGLWQVYKLETDVDIGKDRFRVFLLTRSFFDQDDPTAVEYSEDLFFRAWRLS